MQRKWDGKENHLTAILFCCVNQNGMAFFNSCYFVQGKTCFNKQINVPAFLLINNRLNFGGNFAAAHSDGILTSSMTTSTTNKQDTTPSANQITGNWGSFNDLQSFSDKTFCSKIRLELSYLFTDF